jgi:hypothetical protein
MGDSSDTLQAFLNVFGAASISAPKELDAYGVFNPSMGDDLEEWAALLRKDGFHISIQENVGFGVRRAAVGRAAVNVVVRATSQTAFNGWLKKHISNQNGEASRILFHGIQVKPLARNDPMVYFARDPEYRANIVHYSG